MYLFIVETIYLINFMFLKKSKQRARRIGTLHAIMRNPAKAPVVKLS